MLKPALRLSAAALVAGAVIMLNPATAQAAQADPVTVSFADECGYVAITVDNTTAAPVEYVVAFDDLPDGWHSYWVDAAASRTHKWPVEVGDGLVVTSVAFADQVHDYVQPVGCDAADPSFDGALSCEGSLILVLANDGGTDLNDLRLLRDDVQIGDLIDIAAHETVSMILDWETDQELIIQRLPAEPGAEHVAIMIEHFKKSVLCDGRPAVEVTDTCTGIHVESTNTLDDDLSLQVAIAPPSDFDPIDFPVGAGATLEQDVALANGDMYIVSWTDPTVRMVFGTHTAQGCVPPPRGDLPVTGPRVALAASLGGLLLLTGLVLYFVAQRRRIRSV